MKQVTEAGQRSAESLQVTKTMSRIENRAKIKTEDTLFITEVVRLFILCVSYLYNLYVIYL